MIRALSLSLLLAASLPAQESSRLAAKSLEELLETPIESVTGASRYRQRVTEAPSSVTVITEDEIRRYGWRKLADVLQSVRGFHLTYDRLYNYIGIRGFARPGDYNSRVLVLVNGHRVNENVYDGAYLEDGFPVDMDLVERIEIIRGPGSSLYGTNALFAVVNVQTKLGANFRQTEISLEAASLRTQRVRFTKGSQGKFGQFLASATAFTSQGQREVRVPEFDQPLLNVDRERTGNAFVSWQKGHWTAEGAASLRRKFYPPLWEGQQPFNSNNYGQDVRGYLDVKYSRPLGERTTVLARAYYDRYLFDGRYPYRGETEDQTVMNREFANSAWWGGEVQLNHTLRRHHVTTGFDARLQPLVRLFTYDENPYNAYGGSSAQLVNGGAFVQDEWEIHRKLHLTAGFRWDRYSSFGQTFNPRAALVYQPTRASSLKLLYGQAFRAPNPYELSYESSTFRANPLLVPERVRSLEAVWEHYWPGRWRSSVTVFRNAITRVVSQVDIDGGERVEYQNKGRFSGWGAEAELGYQQKDAWDLLFSYGIQEFHDQTDRTRLANSPRHVGKLRASRPILRGRLTAGGELHYFSRRYTVDRESLSGYFWPSFTLASRRQKVDLSFSVYNILNDLILHPVSSEWMTQALRQNGRGFRAQLRVHLDDKIKPAGR
jgi:outer membrane receptor for ferrienterochelin and colicins